VTIVQNTPEDFARLLHEATDGLPGWVVTFDEGGAAAKPAPGAKAGTAHDFFVHVGRLGHWFQATCGWRTGGVYRIGHDPLEVLAAALRAAVEGALYSRRNAFGALLANVEALAAQLSPEAIRELGRAARPEVTP
jgi:hypothetical protein